jgi:hypothetical protein
MKIDLPASVASDITVVTLKSWYKELRKDMEKVFHNVAPSDSDKQNFLDWQRTANGIEEVLAYCLNVPDYNDFMMNFESFNAVDLSPVDIQIG